MQKNLQRLARSTLRDVAGLEYRCPPRRICHQVSCSFGPLTTGAGDDEHSTSIARIVEDADDGKRIARVETIGGGDVIDLFILSWMHIVDKFPLSLIIKGELEVKDRIEHRRPGV